MYMALPSGRSALTQGDASQNCLLILLVDGCSHVCVLKKGGKGVTELETHLGSSGYLCMCKMKGARSVRICSITFERVQRLETCLSLSNKSCTDELPRILALAGLMESPAFTALTPHSSSKTFLTLGGKPPRRATSLQGLWLTPTSRRVRKHKFERHLKR